MTDVGIEIEGVIGREFTEPGRGEKCREYLDRYGVVIYRGANISDADLVTFSHQLGTVVATNTGETEFPEIQAITLDPAKSALAEYRRGTFYWHFDGAQDAIPQKATLLAAREVAEAGGDTEFASTYLAYEALPAAEQAELLALSAVHSIAASQILVYPDASDEQRAGWAKVPTRTHPLVWTRPNGRRSLVIGATTNEIAGWSRDASAALLERLLTWCTQPQFVRRHVWQVGDLVVWDNTSMLHRALPYDTYSRRLLHRTTLAGELAIV